MSAAGGVTVRPARPADVPEVVAMVRELADYERALDQVALTEEALHAALFEPDGGAHALVALTGAGTVAGFALWFPNFSTWTGVQGLYLEDLFVRPAHRGSGAGRALLAALAAIAVARGWARLDWAVLDWNEPAQGFYRRIGAAPQSEWTGWRLTGAALRELAASAPPAAG